MEIYLFALISIGTLVVGLIGFLEQISKELKVPRLNSVISKISLFLIGTFMILYATYFKESDAKAVADKQKIEGDKELQRRDSLHNIEMMDLQSNIQRKNIETFTNALAPFGLKYDSSVKVIYRLMQDSAKRSYNYNYGSDPYVTLDNAQSYVTLVKDDSTFKQPYIRFNLALGSSENASKKIVCRAYFVEIFDTPLSGRQYRYRGSEALYFNSIGKDKIYKHAFNFLPYMNRFAIYIHGKYSNTDLSRTYNVSEVFGCRDYGQLQPEPHDIAEEIKVLVNPLIK
jgi:hypothetical protein